MIGARIIKALEEKGFYLDFPSYDSKEEIIMELLKQDNQRLNLALPIFLAEEIDYKKIQSKLNNEQKKELNKIIFISQKIYKKESIPNNLNKIIKENKIKTDFSKQEFDNYYAAFKESHAKLEEKEQKIIAKQSKLRLNLDLNKSLAVLFSPAKIRIMEKIFNHQKLTNTELKYYYKAISPINKAVLNPALQDYLRVIEIAKKILEDN